MAVYLHDVEEEKFNELFEDKIVRKHEEKD